MITNILNELDISRNISRDKVTEIETKLKKNIITNKIGVNRFTVTPSQHLFKEVYDILKQAQHNYSVTVDPYSNVDNPDMISYTDMIESITTLRVELGGIIEYIKKFKPSAVIPSEMITEKHNVYVANDKLADIRELSILDILLQHKNVAYDMFGKNYERYKYPIDDMDMSAAEAGIYTPVLSLCKTLIHNGELTGGKGYLLHVNNALMFTDRITMSDLLEIEANAEDLINKLQVLLLDVKEVDAEIGSGGSPKDVLAIGTIVNMAKVLDNKENVIDNYIFNLCGVVDSSPTED